jgi:hypothetical protein
LAAAQPGSTGFRSRYPFNPRSEYRVNNWPATPSGKHWRGITQQRDIPRESVVREPIFPWEAKVYTLV